MPSRVQQKEACLPDDSEMSASSFSELKSHAKENVNEELLKAVEEIYSPVLKMMKLFGAYFGDTSFNRLLNSSGPFKKQSYILRFYCGLSLAGLWLNFVVPLVSVFFGGPIYLLLLFDMWCLLVALNGTICLVVLRLTDARKSRFEKFIRNLISIRSEGINLEKVKSKRRSYLIMFSIFMVSGTAGVVACDVVLQMNLGTYGPWDAWIVFRISVTLFLVIGCGFWLLPMILFCLTCLVLESLFDDLHKGISLDKVDLSDLRMKQNKLCEIVELADSMLCPLLLVIVGLSMPFICFALYLIANLPEENSISFLIICLYWILASAAILAVVMVFGSRVNEKVKD